MSNAIHVHADNWPAIVSSKRPVLVDFWAEWCGPCQLLAPTFERLAKEYGNSITFAKVNVEELPWLAGEYGIRGIPTLLLLQEGKVMESLVGVRPYRELARTLDRYVGASVAN